MVKWLEKICILKIRRNNTTYASHEAAAKSWKNMNENSDCVPVAVVIPCFRCTRTIVRAIDSIVRQTQKPAEVILVDDASGDGTLGVLREIEQQYPSWIKVIASHENSGAASARNAGWAVATQPYIAFLDSDDAWHPQKIEIQYGFVASHPDVILCGHKHRVLQSQDGQPGWQIDTSQVTLISKFAMLLSNPFITPSVMIKREVPYRFLDGRRHMEDHFLWMQVICAGLPTFKHSAELAAIYKSSFGVSGLSSEIHAMGKAELENYRLLYQQNSISLMQLVGLIIYSALKYLRRLAILQWRELRHSFAQQESGRKL